MVSAAESLLLGIVTLVSLYIFFKRSSLSHLIAIHIVRPHPLCLWRLSEGWCVHKRLNEPFKIVAFELTVDGRRSQKRWDVEESWHAEVKLVYEALRRTWRPPGVTVKYWDVPLALRAEQTHQSSDWSGKAEHALKLKVRFHSNVATD